VQYRHSFHAGNFADVHKHVALLALIHALQLKAKGFLFLDTHAAAGLADLNSDDARRSGEAARGWTRLAQSTPDAPEIVAWLAAVRELQARSDTHHYPGSPLLAAHALRAADRGVAVESQAPTARALQRALDATVPGARMQVDTGDGYERLLALWPPRERRSLVLIDPPYEEADELVRVQTALRGALERFETGVIAVWFPIKRERELNRWLERIAATVQRPTLAALLWLQPLDSQAGLNGSGMLVVNPPYAASQRLDAWQQELCALLGGGTDSGTEVRWLVHERAP
jgi:23S rRNA (adenine2030-N6)-methyltransferase